jgi:hypothetical protein
LLLKKMTCFCLKPVFETVAHGECREVVLCALQIAIVALSLLPLPPFKPWVVRLEEKKRGEWNNGLYAALARRTFVGKEDRHDVVYLFSLSFSDNK